MTKAKKNIDNVLKICVEYFLSRKSYKDTLNYFYEYVVKSKTNDFEDGLEYPFFLDWKIVSGCNLRCKHCFFEGDEKNYTSTKDLSTQKCLELIDELSEMSIPQIRLTGGEIFTRNDIFEIIEKIKSKNIALSLSTNATLITATSAEKLAKILSPSIDIVQISLDGAVKETHEITRGKGTFSKTINGINLLVEKKVPLSINCAVTSLNVKELTNLYDLTKQLQVPKMSLSKFIPMNNLQKDLCPDLEMLFDSIAKIIELEKKDKLPCLDIVVFKGYDFVNNEKARTLLNSYMSQNTDNSPESNYKYNCHHGFKAYIDSDGTVYPCNIAAYSKQFSLGNVQNDSFQNIWSNCDKSILFKEQNPEKQICRKCKYTSFCRGKCPIKAYMKYGNINAPDSDCLYATSLHKDGFWGD